MTKPIQFSYASANGLVQLTLRDMDHDHKLQWVELLFDAIQDRHLMGLDYYFYADLKHSQGLTSTDWYNIERGLRAAVKDWLLQ